MQGQEGLTAVFWITRHGICGSRESALCSPGGSEDSREVRRPRDRGRTHPPGFKHILGLPESGQTRPCPPSTAAGAGITRVWQEGQTRAWGAARSCKVLGAHSHSDPGTGRRRLLPGFQADSVVVTEALWPIKTEIVTLWPFLESLSAAGDSYASTRSQRIVPKCGHTWRSVNSSTCSFLSRRRRKGDPEGDRNPAPPALGPAADGPSRAG